MAQDVLFPDNTQQASSKKPSPLEKQIRKVQNEFVYCTTYYGSRQHDALSAEFLSS